MASLYKKVISGKPYWYLREMGWVDGKPKMISERYVGAAADIEALLDAREERMAPERTRHLDFGAVAAAWGLLAELGVAAIIDGETGAGPPLSPGAYLALAALNRVVDPCSKRGFADWWRTTAADRFAKIPASALDHRRFWDAMHAVPGPGGIYDRMEEAGLGPIRWTEAITTRPPSPAEAARLTLAPGVSLLRIVRLASGPAGRPLEVNDSRMSGDEFEISYPLSRDASALAGRE